MNMRGILLYPFFLFLVAFGVDKLPFIGNFPDYFLGTMSFLNYDHKVHLTDELEAYLKTPGHRKVLVMFGNSRTMSFDNEYLETKYPDWILYNYSVPGGTSDYFLHYLEEFQKRGIRPDYIFLAVTPQAFNARAAVKMDEVQLNGLSPGFLVRHSAHYSVDDLTNYVAKQLFWTYQYRMTLRGISQRMKNGGEQAVRFREFREFTVQNLEKQRGSVFFEIGTPARNAVAMEKNAADIWRSFFAPFEYSEDQHYFTARCLEIAREMKVPARLLWARVSPELRTRKAAVVEMPAARGSVGVVRTSVRAAWQPRIEAQGREYGAPLLDMNFAPGFACDRYYDASHLSGECFHEFTDYLMNVIRSGVGGQK